VIEPGARPLALVTGASRGIGAAVELADAVADVDRLDVLVHSAGIGPLGTVEESPAEQWRQTFEINVVAVAELTRLLLPALRAARGRVV